MREFRNGVTYTQLITFKAIVEAGSISGAAKALSISAASVSFSLKSLETLLGHRLFTRSTRKIILTDAGEQLYQSTEFAIAELTSSVELLCDLDAEPSGKLFLNMALNIYQVFLKPVLQEFQQAYPNIQLDITLSDSMDKNTEHKIDIGFRFGETVNELMIARPINQYFPPVKIALFAAKTYAEKYGLPETIEALSRHKLVQFRAPTSGQILPVQLKKSSQTDSEVVSVSNISTSVVVNSVEVMTDMVAQDAGLGFAMDASVAQQLKTGEFIPVLEALWCDIPNVYMYYAPENKQSKKIRCFLDFMKSKLER